MPAQAPPIRSLVLERQTKVAEDLPTLVDNFVVDLPKYEVGATALPDEWAARVERATQLLRGGSYLESARTAAAVARETDIAYPLVLESLYKATACAGYMVEALRLAQAGKTHTTALDAHARELAAAATSPEQLSAYLRRLSGNSDYQPRRPSEVMIAEITFQSAQPSEATGDAAAVEAQADRQLAAGNAAGAIQGFLLALACGYANEAAKARGMLCLGKAYDLGEDRDRAIDWYRKALDSGYLEGALYIDAAVRMATGMHARGQNYTSILWLSNAAEAGDDNAALKAGALLIEMERPVMAEDMLKPLADRGNAEARALLEQLAG